MFVPATASAGPVLLTCTSACGVSGTVTLLALLVGSISVTPTGAATDASFVSEPIAADGTRAVTVKIALFPGVRLTVAAIFPVPDAVPHTPAPPTHDQTGEVSGAGSCP